MKSIRINDENEIQVSHHVFKKRAVLDIRKFYRPPRTEGGRWDDWRATTKGLTVDASRGPALIEMLQAELANEPTPEAANA